MDRYYVLIDEPNQLTLQSKFFTIAVGESERCKRQLEWLRAWAWEHGCYFMLRSRATDLFMQNIAESLGTKVHLIPKLLCKISALVAHIKNFDCTPNMPAAGPQEVYFRKQTEPKYYLFCNTSSRERTTLKT